MAAAPRTSLLLLPAPLLLLLLLVLAVTFPAARAARFTCNSTAPRANTCQALISYSPPNGTATTLAAVRAVFQLRSHRGLLAANGLPLSTPPTAPAPAPVRVRLPCLCSGGVGATFQRPTYRIRAGDTLDVVAKGVFGGLVTFQEIAAANNVSDPNKVAVGQQLWIPVPCSCDPVANQPAVHYTYVVPQGSSVAGIAQEFGTTEETILAVNRMPDAKSLLAGQVLDVPLRACGSNISNTAIDHNLLVPNGTYILTANNCVMCGCSSNSWQLDCQPTQGLSTSACPVAKCGNLFLGNTSSTSTCETTKCAYAGYTNTTSFTILANLTTTNTCNAAGMSPTAAPSQSSAFRLEPARWGWMELVVSLHVVFLCSLGYLRLN